MGTTTAQTGGTTGPLTWIIANGTLTITGSGAMPDYSFSHGPWYGQRSSFTSVIIGNGVTSIGEDAFSLCSGLTSVTIPETLTSIGQDAFAYCSGLTSIIIPESVTSIGYYAFDGCSGLKSVAIVSSVITIQDGSFRLCPLIEIINYAAKPRRLLQLYSMIYLSAR